MNLSSLIQLASVAGERQGDAEIVRPAYDSRAVEQGDLFFCMPSARTDTHIFLNDAARKGVSAAVVHSSEGAELAAKLGLASFLPVDFQRAAGALAHELVGRPTHSMLTIGVTGTNGKTTTAWLMRQMLEALGEPTAYIGTLGYRDQHAAFELGNTTPSAVEMASLLVRAQTSDNKAISMEVSSHALAEHRVDEVEFDCGVFTNLTQDHLDFHGTMEAYRAAKERLFLELPVRFSKKFKGALNLNDEVGKALFEKLGTAGFGYEEGIGDAERVLRYRPKLVEVGRLVLDLRFGGESLSGVEIPVGGQFNVQNCAGSAAALLASGFGLSAVAESFRHVTPVPGRFEPVTNRLGLTILVDYAHTPDALEKLLESVRALTPQRVITVFGCGGDRDKTKRPLMAAAASRLSDFTIVTSDNPRTEDPDAILRDVMVGIRPGTKGTQIVDRVAAIGHAVNMAMPGDVVVIAGKGHEDYQIIGREKIHMDDRELARGAAERREHL